MIKILIALALNAAAASVTPVDRSITRQLKSKAAKAFARARAELPAKVSSTAPTLAKLQRAAEDESHFGCDSEAGEQFCEEPDLSEEACNGYSCCSWDEDDDKIAGGQCWWDGSLTRTVNGTGHTSPSRFCATSS